jgi:hypothetical protein
MRHKRKPVDKLQVSYDGSLVSLAWNKSVQRESDTQLVSNRDDPDVSVGAFREHLCSRKRDMGRHGI